MARKILAIIIIAQIVLLAITAKYEGEGYRQLNLAAGILTIVGLMISFWALKNRSR